MTAVILGTILFAIGNIMLGVAVGKFIKAGRGPAS